MASKRLKNAIEIFKDRELEQSLSIGLNTLREYSNKFGTKFKESLVLSFITGLDQTKQDQILRGFVDLPIEINKKRNVIVFTESIELSKNALDMGAFKAGGLELIDEIQNMNLSNVDFCLADISIMPKLMKVAKKLGQKGLMPNNKFGTVCDSKDLLKNLKLLIFSRVFFKTEKDSSVKILVGNFNNKDQELTKNIQEVFNALKLAKPSSFKGNYIKGAFLSPTMGPSVKITISSLLELSL